MINKEWCKEYALINQGLNADNVFPVAWHNSAYATYYPHQIVGDNGVFTETAMYSSWGTLITVPVQTLPTVDVRNCSPSVVRAALDNTLTLSSVPFDTFKVFNFLSITTAADGWFIPAGAIVNSTLSFSFLGNFERVAQLTNNADRKSTMYVFPYVLAGNLSVSNTLLTDFITLTNQSVSRVNTNSVRWGQNRLFNLPETLDYAPVVFDAMKIQWSGQKTLSFVGYAIQKQASSYQNTRTALFTVLDI